MSRAMRYAVQTQIFKVLANPVRLRVLHALRKGEQSVSDLCQRLDVEQTSMSQQLSVLRANGFVSSDRRGASVYYAIADSAVLDLLECADRVAKARGAASRSMLRIVRRDA